MSTKTRRTRVSKNKNSFVISHPHIEYLRRLMSKGLLENYSNGRDFVNNINADARKLGAKNKQIGDITEAITEVKFRVIDGLTEIYHSSDTPQEIKEKYKIQLSGDDNGIDYVIVDNTGELCAVQIKFYIAKNLTKNQIKGFFDEAQYFKNKLIVTSCEKVSSKIHPSKYVSFKKADWEQVDEKEWKKIVDYINGSKNSKVKEEYDYRDHQDKEAVPNIVKTLRKQKRARNIAPTGVGKTAISLKVQRKLKTRVNLVLAHKVEPAKQWLRNIIKYCDNCVVLPVFSGPSINVSNAAQNLDYPDLSISSTTCPLEITAWHKKNLASGKDLWIVSSYASLPQVAAANIDIDYAIIDEAHHTAGPVRKNEGLVLYDENINIKYRHFTTATPLNQDGVANVSMDDEDLYGPVAFYMTDYEAEKRGLINKVKNLLWTVTEESVNAERGFVTIDNQDVQVNRIATIIAVKQALNKGYKKIVVKFNKRSRITSFASNAVNGLGAHVKNCWIGSVYSGQKNSEKEMALQQFSSSKKPAVLVQCSILDEAWDCPLADCIVFGDPSASKNRIQQFNGRVTRVVKGKGDSGCVVPLFIKEGEGESYDEAVRRTNFDIVCNTLAHRLDPDGVLSQGAGETGPEEVRRIKGFIRNTIRDIFTIEGDAQDFEALEQALTDRMLSRYIAGWDLTHEEIHEYVTQSPEGRMDPDSYTSLFHRSPDDEKIRRMFYHIEKAKTQYNSGDLSLKKIKLCESIPGWMWDVYEAKKQKRVEEVVAYIKKYGPDIPYYAEGVSKEENRMRTFVADIRSTRNDARGVWKDKPENLAYVKKLTEAGFDFRDSEAKTADLRTKQLLSYHKEFGLPPKPSKLDDREDYCGLFSFWHNFVTQYRKKKINKVYLKIKEKLKKQGLVIEDFLALTGHTASEESHMLTLESFAKKNKHCRPDAKTSPEAYKAFKYFRTKQLSDKPCSQLSKASIKRLKNAYFEFEDLDKVDFLELMKVVEAIFKKEQRKKNPRHILQIIHQSSTLKELVKAHSLKDQSPLWWRNQNRADKFPLSFFRGVPHPNYRQKQKHGGIIRDLFTKKDGPIGKWFYAQVHSLTAKRNGKAYPEYKIQALEKVGISKKEYVKYRNNKELAIKDNKLYYLPIRTRNVIENAQELMNFVNGKSTTLKRGNRRQLEFNLESLKLAQKIMNSK